MRPHTRRLLALTALSVLALAGCARKQRPLPPPPPAMRVIVDPSSAEETRLAAYRDWTATPVADGELPFAFCPTETLCRGILGAFIRPDDPRLRGGDHNTLRIVVYERGLTVTQLSYGRPPDWTVALERPELTPHGPSDPTMLSRRVYRPGGRRVLGTEFGRWDAVLERRVFERSEAGWGHGGVWYRVDGEGIPLESLLHVVRSMSASDGV